MASRRLFNVTINDLLKIPIGANVTLIFLLMPLKLPDNDLLE
jgi:hypothetical protein